MKLDADHTKLLRAQIVDPGANEAATDVQKAMDILRPVPPDQRARRRRLVLQGAGLS